MRFDRRGSSWIGLLCACPTLALAGSPHPACEPSEEVAAFLSRFYEGGADEMRPPLLEELASHPNDVHLNRRYQDMHQGDDKPLVERYRAAAAAHPDDPVALYLYGRLLSNLDNPEAEKTLLAALEIDPNYPWAHFALARMYEKTLPDAAKAQAHLAASIEQCPNSPIILDRLADLPKPEIARRAAAVRAQLAETGDPALVPQVQAVWAAEFKTLPPVEHGAVRERMRGDLQLLRGPSVVENRRALQALLAGYKLVGDDAARKRLRSTNRSASPSRSSFPTSSCRISRAVRGARPISVGRSC